MLILQVKVPSRDCQIGVVCLIFNLKIVQGGHLTKAVADSAA